MVKVQRLFAKTNLKIPICPTEPHTQPNATQPSVWLIFLYFTVSAEVFFNHTGNIPLTDRRDDSIISAIRRVSLSLWKSVMNRDLTKGSVVKSMLLFAVPMILGNLLQQCYNIADTLIVDQFLGRNVLEAVGSSFTLMTFLTSVILDLCMGSGALFSMCFG